MIDSADVVFIANDTQFFFRHFNPALSAAHASGLKVRVFLPSVPEGIDLSNPEIELKASPIGRQPSTTLSIMYQAIWLIKQFREKPPRIAIVYSLRACLVMAIALPFVRVRKVVFYITGLGLVELLNDARSRVRRALLYFLLRNIGRSSRCHFIFENVSDAARIGLSPEKSDKMSRFTGAGVDPKKFVQMPFPPMRPLRVATVSRLVWSKGVELAVQAVSALAVQGVPVELSVFGSPDKANPRPLDPNSWANMPGVFYKGNTRDVADVWAQNHVAIFPSRGGEGLPRALLEAASCGRACIVTDVAGCSDFVRDGVEGIVVPVNSVEGIQVAIKRLIEKPSDLYSYGNAARARLIATGTESIVQKQYEELFRQFIREEPSP